MKSLFRSDNIEVEQAYIITIKGNDKSEQMADRCARSCDAVGMPYSRWDAFDGTRPGEIVVPHHSKHETIANIVKVTDHYLTRGEVACALSHISLWVHCAMIDRPIVIFEHDAVMLEKFTHHATYNSIVYLGGSEWVKDGWPITVIPPHGSDGPNYHFICRAHAYSIDPVMAKNLISHVLKMGIHAPLDIMMRADLFNITHQGVFAYDESEGTTIKNRPNTGRTTERNDKLMN